MEHYRYNMHQCCYNVTVTKVQMWYASAKVSVCRNVDHSERRDSFLLSVCYFSRPATPINAHFLTPLPLLPPPDFLFWKQMYRWLQSRINKGGSQQPWFQTYVLPLSRPHIWQQHQFATHGGYGFVQYRWGRVSITHSHTYIYTTIHVYNHTYIYSYTHIYWHAYRHTSIHTYIQPSIRT